MPETMSDDINSVKMPESKIFIKNRALGYVSNHIPLVTRYIKRRKDNLIVTCVGKSFHTYSCSHLSLLTVSGSHPGDITCLAGDTYHVYTASEGNIYAWRRGTELKHTYAKHNHHVHALLPFGPNLISVDDESILKVWDIKTEQLELELNFSTNVFKITTIMHPNTYINKILLGSEQGNLQLWNIRTSKMIYNFNGWNSTVTVVEQAPALDVVAIGLANGKIILHNLKLDETVFQLIQDWGLVTSITFRTDDHERPIMATGSLPGHIVFWNLDEKRVDSQLINAHSGPVAGLQCLPNEPLIVSSSPDNSLKIWIFDLADGAARQLIVRQGHSEPPTCVRFYGDDGRNILTAGGDSSLRIFSTVTEIFNKSLGRASFNRKSSKKKKRNVEDNLIMPPITEFAYEKTREKEWDNIAACHLGLGVVTTWSYDKLKMGEHKILPERFSRNYNANATSVCLTHCGNFVVIGYNTGHVDRFNIQSGLHRATYGDEKGAHQGSVRAIMVDPLNQYVVSAGRDAKVKFWPFKPTQDTEPQTVLTLSEAVRWVRTHPESSLIALALEDFSTILIDLDTRRLVRHFRGHTGHLTDATFSPDARWLVTASLDCTIRTWDIPSAQTIDVFQIPEACISLHFSPTSEFLVTAHMNNVGIYLWSNRTLYSHVSLKALPSNYSIPLVGLPKIASAPNNDSEPENMQVVDEQDDDENKYISPDQLASNLITMSSLANSRWQNLLNIDIIKKRNKPIEPPKAPESAPFFLPTIPSLEVEFDLSDVNKNKDIDNNSKLLIPNNFSNLTSFGKMLKDTIDNDDNDFSKIIERLKVLGPSSIDLQVQSLSSDPTCSVEIMLQFLKMIKHMMMSNRDFELSQSYLGIFLKIHGTAIQNDEKLFKYLSKLSTVQRNSWNLLREKLFYNISVVQYLKKM
ncbi:WD repeat-containing protein 36-like [Microplitis mediator]|uniref:WD repeat-containing protein 36-like n=1 Tax=Microplitis mediator TaxID=375433 RepID=UPI0025535ADC|nr:WD repeat-containing protein 36-like [Microplitis mediator]